MEIFEIYRMAVQNIFCLQKSNKNHMFSQYFGQSFGKNKIFGPKLRNVIKKS